MEKVNTDKERSRLVRFLATGLVGAMAVTSSSSSAEATPLAPKSPAVVERPLAPPVHEAVSIAASLATTWRETIMKHGATVDIAVYNHMSGELIRENATGERFKTASIVKLSILERILLLDQAENRGISQPELSNATPMMTYSDNDAASYLWSQAGDQAGMQAFFNQVGAYETTAGGGGYWGSTLTSAADQVKIVNNVVYPGATLTPESAAVAADLMHRVTPGQNWGITGGIPADVSVGLKNGWYPNDTGWSINSVGFVEGQGVKYTIAVLTKNNPSMQAGIETIEALSADTWRIMRGQ